MVVELEIDGMSCQHCVEAVRRGLENLDGVHAVEVTVGRARIDADTTRVRRDQIEQAIAAEGYEVVAAR